MPEYDMEGMIPSEVRRVRIETIKNTILQSWQEFNFIIFEKLVIEIQMRYGITERLANDYINTAMRSVDAVIKKGEIVKNAG